MKNECSSNDLREMLSDNAQPDYGGESVVRWMKLLENFFLGGGQLSRICLVILENYEGLQKCLNSFEIASNCLTINKKFSLLIPWIVKRNG